MGRPSKFTEKLAAEICERLSAGEPLRAICRDPNMPQWQTIYRWMGNDAEFSNRIAHARELGHDAIAESALDIADDGTNDWMESNDPDNPGYKLNGEHVQRSKLRVETRLKLLAKWSPKKYGDRQHLEHSGSLSLEDLVARPEK